MSALGKGLAGLFGAAAMLALVPQSAQAGTVVAASGPSATSYPVGTQIGDTQRISLRAGDSLTVLDNGGTRVLRGPGTFILARQGGSTRNRAYAALTTQRSATRARTGAVRNTQSGQEIRNPNLWYVNVAAAGKMCLTDRNAIPLWRADTTMETVYTITGAGEPASVTFPEKEMLASFDSEAGLADGATLTISGPDLETPTRVSFVFLDETPADAEATAQALIENGCMGQLEQLSTAMVEG